MDAFKEKGTLVGVTICDGRTSAAHGGLEHKNSIDRRQLRLKQLQHRVLPLQNQPLISTVTLPPLRAPTASSQLKLDHCATARRHHLPTSHLLTMALQSTPHAVGVDFQLQPHHAMKPQACSTIVTGAAHGHHDLPPRSSALCYLVGGVPNPPTASPDPRTDAARAGRRCSK